MTPSEVSHSTIPPPCTIVPDTCNPSPRHCYLHNVRRLEHLISSATITLIRRFISSIPGNNCWSYPNLQSSWGQTGTQENLWISSTKLQYWEELDPLGLFPLWDKELWSPDRDFNVYGVTQGTKLNLESISFEPCALKHMPMSAHSVFFTHKAPQFPTAEAQGDKFCLQGYAEKEQFHTTALFEEIKSFS